MKFRKKPITIEAEQYFDGKKVKGVCLCRNLPPHLHTIHADQIVELVNGDWVISEPDGEHYYPCKPEIFKNTYDAIQESV